MPLWYEASFVQTMKWIYLLLLPNLLTAQPTIEWYRAFGGNSHEEPKAIIATKDGGSLIASHSSSHDGDAPGTLGAFDYWVIKLDSSGELEWSKGYGGSYNDIPRAIIQEDDGSYVIAGYTESNDFDVSGFHGGQFDCWLIKLSANGDLLWQKTYGGSEWDDCWDLKKCLDGGYIFVGSSESSDYDLTENKGKDDYWIVKTDQAGNIQWQKSYGGSNEDFAYHVELTDDGGYLVAGQSASTDGDVGPLNGNVDY